ncbi:DUF4129 domain-containing protein [Gracilimonas halophila]|uniref:DUF4129 domain-containing protein n=1 Tax=Gracilimonas halophila TaxID=1834464 RepID=A0ABW5JKV2_9BACT
MSSTLTKYLFFSLLFGLLSPYMGIAQNTTQPQIPADSSIVDTRTIDTETLSELTEESVFEYNEVAQNPDSLMSRIYGWLMQIIQYIMDNRWTSVIIKFIFFGIFAIVLVALINQILGGNLSTAFSTKKNSDKLSLNIEQSELDETDYDEMLDSALAENRYRDAVRILYLKALQQLNEAELIVWKADKTNHDYLLELNDHPSKTSFSRLTSYYEYVEYGDFQIEENGFSSIQDIYLEFQKRAVQS